jgi:hypothetical protein
MHERALVEDARANLTSEARTNKKSIEGFLATIPDGDQQLERVWDISTKMLAGERIEGTAELSIDLAELTSAAFSTAQLTGAFSSMEYDEVAIYTSVYGQQARVAEMQDQALAFLKAVTSRTWLIEEATPPSGEIVLWRQDIAAARTHLFFLAQFAEQLIGKGYAPLLERSR